MVIQCVVYYMNPQEVIKCILYIYRTGLLGYHCANRKTDALYVAFRLDKCYSMKQKKVILVI